MSNTDNSEKHKEWSAWLADNTASTSTVSEDFGLSQVAEHFGKSDAVQLYWEGASKEQEGDIDGAIAKYRHAYRKWPALDSILQGGLPSGVREEAEADAGFLTSGILIDVIDIACARMSKVMHTPALLNSSDLADIEAVRHSIASNESSLSNNPQNATHMLKAGTFMNNPPDFTIRQKAPWVIGKMIRFAHEAWEKAGWSGSIDAPGPLHAVTDGPASLSIRVVEHWEYQVGGGLMDDLHYDVDSVITIVALLSDKDDFDGGVFRTYEPGDEQLEHPMKQGDVVCFLSHKFHNITALTRGIRKSFVIELWQGGVDHCGR